MDCGEKASISYADGTLSPALCNAGPRCCCWVQRTKADKVLEKVEGRNRLSAVGSLNPWPTEHGRRAACDAAQIQSRASSVGLTHCTDGRAHCSF